VEEGFHNRQNQALLLAYYQGVVMAFVKVRVEQAYGEANIYDGQEVVVIYFVPTIGWVIEEGVVEDGIVELEGQGPMLNDRYFVGIKYKSTMKTFPIRGQGKTNPKSRMSKVNLYVDKRSGNFDVEVGDENGVSSRDSLKLPGGYVLGEPREDGTIPYTLVERGGRQEVNIGTSYVEEPYIKVESTGIEPVIILGIDAEFRIYER
jgi:hypothetical protein